MANIEMDEMGDNRNLLRGVVREDPGGNLRQELSAFQIFFMVVSMVIGTGIYSGNGVVLQAVGPAGLMFALTLIGIVAICMLEGLSEMIQLFAAPSALIEYVRHFVDGDLALVVGVAYWAAYAHIHGEAAASIAHSFFPNSVGICHLMDKECRIDIGIMFFVWPLSIIAINLLPIKYFGWIESGAGLFKLMSVWILTSILYFLAGTEPNAARNLTAGYTTGNDQPSHPGYPQMLAFGFLIFSFLGVEVVGVTAYEARELKDLRNPPLVIGFIILGLYLWHTFAQALSVAWCDPSLGSIAGSIGETVAPLNDNSELCKGLTGSSGLPLIIIAARRAGYDAIENLFSAFLFFSCYSASNIGLYVSSRILFGLVEPFSRWNGLFGSFSRILRKESNSGIPIWSVVFSALAFSWVPLLQSGGAVWAQSVVGIFDLFLGLFTVVIWGTQCLAYLRFYFLVIGNEAAVGEDPERLEVMFHRWNPKTYGAWTVLHQFQPYPAIIGLVGCISFFIILCLTPLWQGLGGGFIAAFAVVPALLPTFWLVLKVRRLFSPDNPEHMAQDGFWYVRLPAESVQTVFNKVKYLKPSQQRRQDQRLN